MFWKFDLHTSSHIDALLERENVTLFELLDEEDVLQECKVVNRKLVEFLVQPQHMEALVTCVTEEYPSVSCEILTSDVSQINDALGEDEELLRRLYGFLQSGGVGLNPLLASFFSKVMGILINRKTDQIVSFLRKKEDFVNLLLCHIGTSAIMDLLLRLLTCVEQPQLRQDVFNWLNEEKIVQRLIDLIHPSKDDNQHSNASQSLCDIIRLSREQMIQIQESPEPDQLLATLENPLSLLKEPRSPGSQPPCSNPLAPPIPPREPRSPGSHGGVGLGARTPVLCEGDSGILGSLGGRGPVGLGARTRGFFPGADTLFPPPQKEPLQMTWGMLDPPLGNTRLNVVKLLASSLCTNHPALRDEVLELGAVDTMLDLYFKYSYNNFLHTQVEAYLSIVFGSPAGDETIESSTEPIPENPVIRHLLQKCRIIQRILSAWEENERVGFVEGNLPAPGTSPLTLLLPHFVELPEEEQEQWETFVSGPLAETNKRNTVDLVNMHNLHSSSDDDESDLKEFNFPQEAVLQQAFVDYQLQQMTSAFIDHFGFNDEEFGEQEESVNAPFDKTANITFSLNADDDSPNSNLFELCYKERIQQFDDEEDDEGSDGEDIWQDKERGFSGRAQPAGTRYRDFCSTDSEDSRDSEEEEEGGTEGDPGGGDQASSPPSGSIPEMEAEKTSDGEGLIWPLERSRGAPSCLKQRLRGERSSSFLPVFSSMNTLPYPPKPPPQS
uniref:Protein phosphatase 6 regulatory subunit 1 n=1 Tax=Sphenodon punctatus TaxID=8508 RepID=A0A8D0GCQ0_SPHPU